MSRRGWKPDFFLIAATAGRTGALWAGGSYPACPVGQAGWQGSVGWHHAGVKVVAQGVMLGIAHHRRLERRAGTDSMVVLWVFGAGGKIVPQVRDKPVPAAGWVSW